jgi:hypothetical protein
MVQEELMLESIHFLKRDQSSSSSGGFTHDLNMGSAVRFDE